MSARHVRSDSYSVERVAGSRIKRTFILRGACELMVDTVRPMDTTLIDVATGDRLVTDITDEVTSFTQNRGDGLVHVFAPHATAGLALIETGSGSESDLQELLERLLPRDDRYRHRHGSRGHGADHLLPALVSPALTVPAQAGSLLLGTWQRIVLVDPNADNPRRQVRISFLPG
jgi:secondary thiamine-phosphate synthase enzyme